MLLWVGIAGSFEETGGFVMMDLPGSGIVLG
jgi:hypothetical protein